MIQNVYKARYMYIVQTFSNVHVLCHTLHVDPIMIHLPFMSQLCLSVVCSEC